MTGSDAAVQQLKTAALAVQDIDYSTYIDKMINDCSDALQLEFNPEDIDWSNAPAGWSTAREMVAIEQRLFTAGHICERFAEQETRDQIANVLKSKADILSDRTISDRDLLGKLRDGGLIEYLTQDEAAPMIRAKFSGGNFQAMAMQHARNRLDIWIPPITVAKGFELFVGPKPNFKRDDG